MACTLLRSTALLLLFVLCTAQEVNLCGYPHIQNGGLYYNEPETQFPKRVNDWLYFRCNSGFLAADKKEWQSITCTKSGWNPKPKCFKKCNPQQIQHGRFIYSRNTVFIEGDDILIRCDRGYYPANQQATVKCTKNGWLPTPRCIAPVEIVCSPPQILNGSFEPEQLQYEYQESINILCEDGYKSSGTSVCTAHGWHPPPTCILNLCGYPRIQNGSLYYDEPETQFPKRVNDWLYFRCNSGFLTADKKEWQSITCTKSGWNPKPKCFKIVCSPPQILNGSFEPEQLQYEYQESINILCEDGYKSSGTSVCTAHGWHPPPTCILNLCGYPRIQNGSLYYDEPETQFPKRVNDWLYFRCNSGFLTADKKEWQSITCTKNGWNPKPKCFKKCNPQQIQHGRFLYSWSTVFIEGDDISIRCDRGYYPANQQATVKCTKNGWLPTPRCIAPVETERKCDRPPSTENGDITEILKKEYNSGDSVQYKCQRYYRMEGTPVVSCLNGHWSETPRCLVPCTTSQEDMQRNNIRFRWSRDEKMYFESGAQIEFTCRWPYDPAPSSPPFIVQCIDGTFEYPQCI